MRNKASGTKYANATQNECSETISNLRRETRDFLLTETSPFNQNRTPKRLVVEVGRISTGLFKVYTGDIISAQPSSPPDVDIVLKSKTGTRVEVQSPLPAGCRIDAERLQHINEAARLANATGQPGAAVLAGARGDE